MKRLLELLFFIGATVFIRKVLGGSPMEALILFYVFMLDSRRT